MVITYTSSKNINYPVFPLLSSNWDISDGLLTIDGLLVDDKNMDGDTLGKRRLQTPFKSLFPLKKSINSFIGIIKQSKNNYIDNKGIVFTYEKTKYVPLKYIQIQKVEKKKIASLIYLRNYKVSFQVPRPPDPELRYAGVLFMDNDPWMLYDYANRLLKSTRRKI